MTANELKQAFMNNSEIEYDGTTYPRINALIYRRSGNNIIIQAELLDLSSSVHSVYIVSPVQLGKKEDLIK